MHIYFFNPVSCPVALTIGTIVVLLSFPGRSKARVLKLTVLPFLPVIKFIKLALQKQTGTGNFGILKFG